MRTEKSAKAIKSSIPRRLRICERCGKLIIRRVLFTCRGFGPRKNEKVDATLIDVKERQRTRDRCKRVIQAYVCQIEKGVSLLETVRILNTAISHIEITQYQMKLLFHEVQEKTIEAFQGHDFYSDRRNRFDELKRSLGL